MNISKFSRGIVVVIFVAFIISSCVLDFSMLISIKTDSRYSGIIKLVYMVLVFCLVAGYIYLKDKLYKIKMGRKISLLYRYIYLILISIGSILVTKGNILRLLVPFECITIVAFNIFLSFIVKRIIFNVSKSDMLSVFGMCMSSLLINIIEDKFLYFNSLAIALSTVITVLILQKLIDELKQKGMRTQKYILQSLLLGTFIGINIVLGINYIVWIIIAISTLFITIDLDSTHINFPKKLMSSLTQEKRESLYRIERINISKLLVSIFIVFIMAIIVVNIGNSILDKYSQVNGFEIIQNLRGDANKLYGNFGFMFMDNLKIFLEMSKTYYFAIFIYILSLEILAFLLNRRYDTKSTIIKLLFLSIFISITYFNLNILMYQPLFSILLVVIAIVNTSNIYLNREERIKLLVS